MSLPEIDLRVLETTATGQLVEWLYDDGSNDSVLVCAAHGGRIEPGTAEQAIELASRLDEASCWARLGHDSEQEEFELWHTASRDISPADHPLLESIADRGFEMVISFHGLEDERLIVGGDVGEETRRLVRNRLNDVVEVEAEAHSRGKYSGTSSENFVNWLAAGSGGLQLEQGPVTREEEANKILRCIQNLVKEGIL